MPRAARKLTIDTLQALHARLNELAIADPTTVAAIAVLVESAHRKIVGGRAGEGARARRPKTPRTRG